MSRRPQPASPSTLRRLRLPVAATAAAVLALGPASAAWAHIHADPSAVQAGKPATVGFGVEHGCEDSPTVKLEIQMPAGATNLAGVDGDGFTSSVSGQVVTFEGGPLAADTEKSFQVSFTAPAQAGDVPVKIIQTCEVGEIDWIEVAAEGEDEPDHPAPILTITEGTPPTTEAGEDHHAEEGDDDHHAEEGTATTEADHHAEETTEADHHAEVPVGSSDDSDSSSSAPLVIGGIVLLAAVGGGGYALAKRNAAKSSDAAGAGDSDSPESGA